MEAMALNIKKNNIQNVEDEGVLVKI